MSREYCNVCKRALRGCICGFTAAVSNRNFITILRHPSEKSNIKGTAELLRLSLSKIALFDGELFEKHDILHRDIENVLIFPSESSIKLRDFSNNSVSTVERNFIFIDGTWKKAYKILQLNPFLKELTHLNLDFPVESIYGQIRKQRSGGLSTLEATVTTLKQFEKATSLAELEESFERFVQRLKNFAN